MAKGEIVGGRSPCNCALVQIEAECCVSSTSTAAHAGKTVGGLRRLSECIQVDIPRLNPTHAQWWDARSKTPFNIRTCRITESGRSGSRRTPRFQPATRCAFVTESPQATRVTWCPWSTSASVDGTPPVRCPRTSLEARFQTGEQPAQSSWQPTSFEGGWFVSIRMGRMATGQAQAPRPLGSTCLVLFTDTVAEAKSGTSSRCLLE